MAQARRAAARQAVEGRPARSVRMHVVVAARAARWETTGEVRMRAPCQAAVRVATRHRGGDPIRVQGHHGADDRPPTLRRMDARRRTLVPERLLLPPAPREPDLAARWGELPFDERRRLALAATGGTAPSSPDDRELVAAVARARVATGWRLQIAAAVLGWLVLMTVWGFGRSTFPADEDRWLAAGLALGTLVWALGAVVARRRIRRATELS